MLFSSVLVDRSTREAGIAAIEILGLPDEVLEQIALVFGEEKVFRLSDDLFEIGN
jgi:hypothetical protein